MLNETEKDLPLRHDLARLDRLLAELAIHRLDLVIADSPIPPSVDVRAYNHLLGDSGLSFFAARALVDPATPAFPACMGALPALLPGEDSAIRRKFVDWLDRKRLRPRIAGEFDDTALMTAFGRAGVGAFAVPTAIEAETLAGGELVLLGRAEDVRIEYFAISVERRLTHPCVLAISEAARAGLGVALVPRFFVIGEMASGQLLTPCPYVLHNQRSYYLVYPESKADSVPLAAFREWMCGQAAAYRELAGVWINPAAPLAALSTG